MKWGQSYQVKNSKHQVYLSCSQMPAKKWETKLTEYWPAWNSNCNIYMVWTDGAEKTASLTIEVISSMTLRLSVFQVLHTSLGYRIQNHVSVPAPLRIQRDQHAHETQGIIIKHRIECCSTKNYFWPHQLQNHASASNTVRQHFFWKCTSARDSPQCSATLL